MRRRLAAAALALAFVGGAARADERAERDLSGEPGFSEISPAELRALEAYAELRGGRPIRARELAQELLREDPESVEGHVLLGSVLYEAEGDLARARHMLLRGKRLFERKHGRLSGEGEVQIWHAEALRLLDQVASEMGREREALGYQREWQAVYGGGRPGWSAWLLMRLGRLDEARRVAELSLKEARGVDSRDSARAALCAVHAEALDRDATYQACVEGARQSKAEGGDGAVPWSNAAEAAGMALRLGEVERLLLEATRHAPDDFVNPWSDLAILYTSQGRLSEAQSALREMVGWRESQAANVRAQTWAHSDLAAAEFLLAAGRSEDAARITERALATPDRHGSSNEDPGQRSAAAALLDAAVERTRAQEAWEATSWLPLWRAVPAWFAGCWHAAKAWLSERRAMDGLSNPRFLASTLRPYLADQITLPEWLQPELVRVLGPGLSAAALGEARAAETHPVPAAGYFAALDCEIARLRGDYAEVGQAARRALIALPQSEVLLRARAAALHGDAARRDGDAARSVAAYDLALQRDPGVVRRLGLTLPVHFEVSGDALAEEAAAFLRRSPRLEEASGGFRLQVSAAGESGRACLVGAFGEVIGCGRVEPRAGEDVRTRARRLAQDFHEGVFSARISLSQADLRSLDGSPLAAGRSSVELAVPELFGDVP